MRPGERQLWRVVNASSVTYPNLALLFDRSPQRLGVVAIDGVPLTHDGQGADAIAWTDHIGLAPAGRAEFIVTGPSASVPALLVTRTVDTGLGGENDPNRALVSVIGSNDAEEPASRLSSSPKRLPPTATWLGAGTTSPIRSSTARTPTCRSTRRRSGTCRQVHVLAVPAAIATASPHRRFASLRSASSSPLPIRAPHLGRAAHDAARRAMIGAAA
jgi:hypothetical protein